MKRHRFAITGGMRGPAMSISWEPPTSPNDSGFVVIFADFDPDDADNDTAGELVCLECLIEAGDEQLGRGLDLARCHGRVDYDPRHGEWFVPEDRSA